jgi:hypothetical protein
VCSVAACSVLVLCGYCTQANAASCRPLFFSKTGIALLPVFLPYLCSLKSISQGSLRHGEKSRKKKAAGSLGSILNAGHDLCKIEVVQKIEQEMHLFLIVKAL